MVVSMSLRPESENVFGLVVGRVLENVGNGGDEDALPDYLPAPPGARVVFTPLQARVTTTGPTAFLRRSPVTCHLDKETGEILSSSEPRQVGVWLAQGVWRVTFYTGGGAEIPSFTFEVTGAHTVFEPLDLVTVAPYSPPPGGSTVVVELPGGAASGLLLGWSEAGLAWVEQTGGLQASWSTMTGKPAVIAAGESVVEARAVIGAVSVEDLPDVSGFATTASLTAGLTEKQPVGDYAFVSQLPDVSGLATTAALTSGLATKQAAGDYATRAELPDVSGLATKTALTEGLATKQPVGDYATTTALTSGLAGKQPVGDYATRAELPDVSGFATTAYVDQMVGDIDTALSGILGGE